jgi:putative tryptophan/tyrosine transport system substrate-binding protein
MSCARSMLSRGSYVDRILRRAKPGDLPVQASTEFERVISLTTAKALAASPTETADFTA